MSAPGILRVSAGVTLSLSGPAGVGGSAVAEDVVVRPLETFLVEGLVATTGSGRL